MWEKSSSNWETMYKDASKLYIAFATSGILVTRATGTIIGADADAIYDHFITPKGLLLLDPTMDVEEAGKYIERYTKGKLNLPRCSQIEWILYKRTLLLLQIDSA